ncbi:hypothetical protein B9Z19DRAFT_1086113 [Tuber borchii]|uniref:Uncharacterized protein n=1 Tax=Tuber borchii TaxID=42251 RepID=A0A2T6ZPV3_TUBBO|nr:hypothetical protein B9Z19DRAFT_1086113 [Tuber borchii]
MGHSSTIHRRTRSSHDIQTSAFNQTSYEKNAIPYPTAKDTPPQLYPIKDLPSPQQLREGFKWVGSFKDHTTGEAHSQEQEDYTSTKNEYPPNETPDEKNVTHNLTAREDPPSLQQFEQLFEQREAEWYQRYQDLHSKFGLQILECQTEFFRCSREWHVRFEKINQEILEKSIENATLIAAVLYQMTEKMISKENFNVRGALERMVHHAKLIKKIGAGCPTEIQAGLNELAKTPAFTKVLRKEAASRGLKPEAVTPCIASVYGKVCQHAHGNDYIITLYEEGYTASELTVLATFLRMQSEWPHGLQWREEKRKKYTKH